MYLQNILPFAHSLLKGRLQEGASALDGTAGNGHDTLMLAQAVGKSGCVWAFDVQAEALAQTRLRLEAADAATQVRLIHSGHEHLADYVDKPLDAAVFNFGWLPGSDKTCTTEAATSIAALQAVLELLKTGGLVAAALYPGHEAGQHEAASVEAWASALPQSQYAVLKYGFTNRRNRPPYLLLLEKLS